MRGGEGPGGDLEVVGSCCAAGWGGAQTRAAAPTSSPPHTRHVMMLLFLFQSFDEAAACSVDRGDSVSAHAEKGNM